MRQLSLGARRALSTRTLDRAYLLVRVVLNDPLAPEIYLGPTAQTFEGNFYEGLLEEVRQEESGLDVFSLTMKPGGLTFTVLNNKPFMRWNRFSDILGDYALYNANVTVYWTAKGGSASFILFRGKVQGVAAATEELCRLNAVELPLALEHSLPMRRLSANDFPSADPDHVGRVIPRVWGRVERLRCLAVDAGSVSNITGDINDSAAAIELTDASLFPSSGTVQIDAEKISYTGKSSNSLTGCTRGAGGTYAVAHNKGATVAEVQSDYVYLVADHPVKAIDAVYVDRVRQTGGFTAYTGQSGDELAGYEGSAVVVFSTRPSVAKQINVTHTHTDTIGVSRSDNKATMTVRPNGHSIAGTVNNPGYAYDKNDDNYAALNATASLRLDFPDEDYGTITKQTVWARLGPAGATTGWTVSCKTPPGYTNCPGNFSPSTLVVSEAGLFGFEKSGGSWDDSVMFTAPNDASGAIYEVWKEVEYTPTVSKTGATTGSLTGNTTAETVIGRVVAVDVQGYPDDASGTYTGTPNALIERPDHIRRHMLIELYGLTSDEIDSTSFDAAGAQFVANSYTLSVVLDKDFSFTGLAAALARQCRAAIFWSGGREKMKWLAFGADPAGAVSGEALEGYELSRISRERIRNRLRVLFYRRWDVGGQEAFRKVAGYDDPESQAACGSVSQTMRWPWVANSGMAQHVLGFWGELLGRERLMVKAVSFWPSLVFEPGDVVDFSSLALHGACQGAPGFLIFSARFDEEGGGVLLEGVEL